MTLPLGITLYVLFIVLAYLMGSISSSIILGKYFYGIDVREYGSKNPGANNTQRVLGWKIGLLVLAFDILKGVAATSLVFFLPFPRETIELGRLIDVNDLQFINALSLREVTKGGILISFIIFFPSKHFSPNSVIISGISGNF